MSFIVRCQRVPILTRLVMYARIENDSWIYYTTRTTHILFSRLVNSLYDSYGWTSELYESIKVVSIGHTCTPTDSLHYSCNLNPISKTVVAQGCELQALPCLEWCRSVLSRMKPVDAYGTIFTELSQFSFLYSFLFHTIVFLFLIRPASTRVAEFVCCMLLLSLALMCFYFCYTTFGGRYSDVGFMIFFFVATVSLRNIGLSF